jgi:hypothetical protein
LEPRRNITYPSDGTRLVSDFRCVASTDLGIGQAEKQISSRGVMAMLFVPLLTAMASLVRMDVTLAPLA